MIKTNTPILTAAALIGGCFFMLTVPSWMAYALLTSIGMALVMSFSVNLVLNHWPKIKFILSFCTEFCGFCLLMGMFIGTVVMMNHVLMS